MDFVNKKLEEFNKFLDGKRIAIIGMGVSNLPLLDYFYDKNAKVTVFNNNVLSDEIMEKINNYRYEVEVGSDNLSRLNGYDIIFRSPSALPTLPELHREV
ncbi:UDP-N-acetylmuramoylalanine/D-glutamate ligase, partial [human gut metagenome]